MIRNTWIRNGLMAVIILVLGISCNKDEDNVQLPVTRAQLLARAWIQTDLLALINGSNISVFTTVASACQRDNIWTFKSDGTYSVSEGATKCNAGDPDIATTGTWQLTDADSKIIIDDVSEDPQTFTITELTSSSLKITGTIMVQGSPVTGTAVFQPQ